MAFRIQTVEPLYTLPCTIRAEFTYNPWVSALWETVLPSKNLVDVVAGIFTGVTSAVQVVKDGLSKAWDGIQGAGQFIANGVLQTIALGFEQLASGLLEGFLRGIGSLSQFTFSQNQNSFSLDYLGKSSSIRTELSGLGFLFSIGELQYSLPLHNLLQNSLETLGLGQDLALQSMRQILDYYILSLGLLVLGVAFAIVGIGIPLLFWSLLSGLLALAASTGRAKYTYDTIEMVDGKKEFAGEIGPFFGSMKDLFIIVGIGAGINVVATYALESIIISNPIAKFAVNLSKFADSVYVILDLVNIYNANYPSFIRERLMILGVQLLSLTVLSFLKGPVAIALLIYVAINGLLFALLESFYGGVD